MYKSKAFSILGIEPTDDKGTIKKAYAGLVKKYHPEEYPEKWREIHEAYETAIKSADTMRTAAAAERAAVLPSERELAGAVRKQQAVEKIEEHIRKMPKRDAGEAKGETEEKRKEPKKEDEKEKQEEPKKEAKEETEEKTKKETKEEEREEPKKEAGKEKQEEPEKEAEIEKRERTKKEVKEEKPKKKAEKKKQEESEKEAEIEKREGTKKEVKEEKPKEKAEKKKQEEPKKETKEEKQEEPKKEAKEERQEEPKKEETEEKREKSKKEIKEEKQEEPKKEAEKEEQEFETVFENLSELAKEQKEKQAVEQEKMIDETIRKLEELVKKSRFFVNRKAWEEFFLSQDNMIGICSAKFLYRLGDLLLRMQVNDKLFFFLNRQLRVIAQCRSMEQGERRAAELLQPIAYAQERLKKGHEQSFTFKPHKVIAVVMILFFVFTVVKRMNEAEEKRQKELAKESLHIEYERLFNNEDLLISHNPLETLNISYDSTIGTAVLMEVLKRSTEEKQQELLEKGVRLREEIYLTELDFIAKEEKMESLYEIEEKEVSWYWRRKLNIDEENDKVFSFNIISEDKKDKIIWVDLERLNFTENCKVYSYDLLEDKYKEVTEWKEEESWGKADRYWYKILNFRVFPVDIRYSQFPYPVIIVEKADRIESV